MARGSPMEAIHGPGGKLVEPCLVRPDQLRRGPCMHLRHNRHVTRIDQIVYIFSGEYIIYDVTLKQNPRHSLPVVLSLQIDKR